MSLKDEKRKKAIDLIENALDDGAGFEECRTFAVRAIKIIQKYDLLTPPPLDGILENETVRAVKNVADKLSDPSLKDSLKTLFKQGVSAVAESKRRRRR